MTQATGGCASEGDPAGLTGHKAEATRGEGEHSG
jgi:hypothetical protein